MNSKTPKKHEKANAKKHRNSRAKAVKHSTAQRSQQQRTATAVQNSSEAQHNSAENAESPKEPQIVKLNISKPAINRHLEYLVAQKKIIIIKPNDFRKYGLPEKDKKASYLTLAKNAYLPQYYDLVMSSLDSKDHVKKKNALLELESMRSIKLLPSQLTNLALKMPKEDYETGALMVKIIYSNMQKSIFPSDLEQFQHNLISYYEKNKEKVCLEVKSHILFMLGILNSSGINTFLKEDILKNKTFQELRQEGYCEWYVAKVIDESKLELFEFQNSLKDDKLITVLSQIRTEARRNMTLRMYGEGETIYNSMLKHFKPKLQELQK